MKLSQMFENAPEIGIAGLCTDSRCTKANDMHFCMEGMVHDGREFIDDVVEKGAKYIVHSKPVDDAKREIVYIQMGNVNHILNRVASMFYGYPSRKMKVFDVTGTNRKSTVTSITWDVYSHFTPCDYIGTISVSYKEVTLSSSLITPNAVLIHKTVKDMVEHGMWAVASEVSSHGLELGRVQDVDFDVAVFSNLTYDHPDFHGMIERYFGVKKRLFINLKKEGTAMLNADDAYVDQLADATEAGVVTYGADNHATYQTESIRIEKTGSRFTLVHGVEHHEVSTNLVALYNIYNLLGAVAATVESGISIEQRLPYLHDIRQIEGYMECIDEGQLSNVIADSTHTSDGMEEVLEYAKNITGDRHSIIAVSDSAGKRGTKKRKVFGRIASHYCDSIILTEDDPRDEDPREIVNEIKSGISDTNNIFIAGRYAAIRQTIESANVKDIVLVLGKGDEAFIYRGSEREL